ncbi:MAG: transcription antitermination factor NusB [Hyphomicrobiaceae bacterium]|nr:transcription antitermination factor NusB [Hyphomicrobiaceae bacterium]
MTASPKRAGGQRRSPAQAARRAARVAAVQAIYQMDLAGTDVTDVIREFTTERFPNAAMAPEPGEETETFAGADPTFFGEIVRGVVRRQRDIDPMIDQQLAIGWRLKRIETTLRAILRAGSYELIERHDVPARVVINEYIDISHAFFDEDEPKVANGVLDRLARRLRVAEFEGQPGQPGQQPAASAEPASEAGTEQRAETASPPDTTDAPSGAAEAAHEPPPGRASE